MYYLTNEYHENCSKGIYSYSELRSLLIREAEEEIKLNCGDKEMEDLIKNNLDVLVKLARDTDYNPDYVVKELEAYGWIVYDLTEVKQVLMELVNYPTSEKNRNAFNEVLKVLDTLK